MPIYQITGLNGKVYQIEGPPNVTKDQIRRKILERAPEAGVPPQGKSAIEDIPLVGGVLGQAADYPAQFVSGLAGVGKSVTDVFGARNRASNFLQDVVEEATALRSEESRTSEKARAIRSQLAEKQGTMAEVGAAARNFLESPFETTAQVAGSAVPFVAAALAAPETGGMSLLPMAAMLGLGAVSGVGTIKGDIYDAMYEATYEQGIKQGLPEVQAKARAEKAADEAQAYGGENLDQIALGGALGAAASATGFTRQIAGTIGRRASAKVAERIAMREAAEAAGQEIPRQSLIRGAAAGVAEEAIPEAGQAGQERYAQNLALQRAGYDVDPWQGVAGQAAAEGIASILLGGYGGVRETQHKNAAATAQQYAAKVEALPDAPTNEDVAPIAEWALRRGFNEEEAALIAKNAADQKRRVAEAKAQMEEEAQRAAEARTAGVERPPEPDISQAPPVDEEEQAARYRAYAEEAGAAPEGAEQVDAAIAGLAPRAEEVGAELRRAVPQAGIRTPQQAAMILNDPVALSDYEAEGGDINDLYDLADSVRYSRPVKPKAAEAEAAGQESLFGAMPTQTAERLSKAEELTQRKLELPPEERVSQLEESLAQAQQKSEQAKQRDEAEREERRGDIEYALRAQAPENAVYDVRYEPEDTNAPYKLVAQTHLGKKPELVYKAKSLQDMSDYVYGNMDTLTPYIPEAPARLQELETQPTAPTEKPTFAAKMVQDFSREVDDAHAAGQIDNSQRAELLNRMYRPDAYKPDAKGNLRPNDAIAKLEVRVNKAEEAYRAEETDEAKEALTQVKGELRAAVQNGLINPARAALKSMVEMRQDERVGAKVRIKEALAALDKRMVILVHGGSDFDALNKRLLGTGEPGGIRPLGNGFYGYLVDKTNAQDVERAIGEARRYAEKYGRRTPALHAFQLDMTGIETGAVGPVIKSLKGTSTNQRDAYLAAKAKYGDAPFGSEGWRKLKQAYEGLKTNVGLVTERLPSGLIEGSINELERLERVGKERLESDLFGITSGGEELISTVKDMLLKGKQWEREARKELREAKIDLAQQKVSKFRMGAEKPAQPVSPEQVQGVVDTVASQFKGLGPVTVVKSVNDIADPRLRRAITRDNAHDAKGFVAPDGGIYLVADNIESAEDAKAVLFHEALGHTGLEKLFRNNLDNALVTMYRGNAQLRADVEKWRSDHPGAYDNDRNPLARAVEEVLAERSEKGQLERNLFQKLAAVVRNFARRMGINLKISDGDVAAILSMAHDKVVRGDKESVAVKGLRYIKEDRIRVPGEAAKTFLRELGLFNNRELMDMDPEEASTRASRVGIDQEWMDYYTSRRLAARAPEGAEPVKLPQPDMSKYMPKYSRPKTSKTDAEKLDEAEARMSEGQRKVNKTFSTMGLNEGLEDMAAAHDSTKFAGAIADNYEAIKPAAWKALLASMPSSGILNWFKRIYSPLHTRLAEIDTLVHKMHSMKQRLIIASDDLARAIDDHVRQYGTKELATAQFVARINEFAPDKFASAAEALQKDDVIQAIEKSLLSKSNNEAETRRLMEEIKRLVMRNDDSPTAISRYETALGKVAKDPHNIKRDVAQLAEMSRRIRDTMAAWDALGKQKNGQRIYKEMRAYYKDMFDAELALLDERIDRIMDKKEAKRLRDKRAELMREIQSPAERKKSGDIFWNINNELFQKDYFPFMREGKYWISVSEDKAAGRERELHTFDTALDMRKAQRRIAARLGVDSEENGGVMRAGWDIGDLQDRLRNEDELMQRVFSIIGEVRKDYAVDPNKVDLKDVADAIYQTWLMTTPERSVRRRLMHAEEVVGMSPDVLLHFKKQATAYANQLSKLMYAGDIRTAVQAARDLVNGAERPVSEKAKFNAVVNEFDKRAEQEMNPDPHNAVVNFLNRASYYYYLTSAATALVNFTSIPIRVVPRLWRDYGFAKGSAMWLKYMRVWDSLGRVKVTRESTRVGDYIDALMPNVNGSEFVKNNADLQWAKAAGTERGVLETVHETLVQNERATPKGTKQGAMQVASDVAGTTGKLMSFLFTGTENITRQAAYYMTFELALDKYRKANPDASIDEARKHALGEALNVVRDTLGDYSSWERPRLAKKNWTRAFFLFKMFPMLQTKFMIGAMRDIAKGTGVERTGAIKELTGVLGMAGMFGGVMGMPLYWVMTQALMAAFGPDKDDDDDVRALMGGDPRTAYDPDIAFRSWMNDKFGSIEVGGIPLSTILTEGPISALTGTELASRTTLDLKNLWFRDAVAGDSLENSVTETAIQNIAGLSMVSSMLGSYERFKEGDNRGALAKALPAFFRSWVNAYYTGEEGVVTGRKDTLIPKDQITTADMIRTTLGLRAPRVARMQEYYISRAKNEKSIKTERDHILDRLERAYNNGELSTRAAVDKFIADEVVPFNRMYPDPEFLLTEKSMVESIKRRAGIRARTYEGVQFDKKTAPKDVAAQQRFVQ